jgi:glycosyltransferase involved in cell wall biosynthesis
MKMPISVIIITLNEEKNIGPCLESVKDLADEILVIDSGSTDKTLEIAARYTDKILNHEFVNFARQRNWAQDNLATRNEWILHLDADERISTELAQSFREILSSSHGADAVSIARKTIFRGKWVRFGGHYPVYHVRLFKKHRGRCESRLYDQHFVTDGKIIKARGDIINIINPDIEKLKSRHTKWAVLEAMQAIADKRKKPGLVFERVPMAGRRWVRCNLYYALPPFLRAYLYFFYRYIFRLGFMDGVPGAVFHFYQGLWYRLLVDKEIYKLKENK